MSMLRDHPNFHRPRRHTAFPNRHPNLNLVQNQSLPSRARTPTQPCRVTTEPSLPSSKPNFHLATSGGSVC